jgi:alkylation response protein AidB-like acyl-CoA dehydrogenase
MTTESHYKPNRRDIDFNLFEFHKVQDRVLGKGEFTSMDEATAKASLDGIEKMATGPLAASYAEADKTPLLLDADGNVTLPESLKKSLNAWFDADWHRFELPERLGGFGAPPSLVWAGFEMVAGANASAAFYQFGTFIARVIDTLGTDDQKKRYVDNMIERRWGATMVLTEPDAGSDVGNGRSKAKQVDGNLYEIEGVKRFITNGDFDGVENIVHLVLARPEGAGPGTKGLSMFIVPKFWVNEDGSLGERNGAKVTNVEKKMGIKASATCELTMGGDKPCRGLLVGGVHDGIAQMFMVIEQARMSIGMKSMSHLSTAYLNALAYAKDRVQGPDLLQIMDKTAPRVSIIRHPDVRRMLLNLKAHAEGMRALAFWAASIQDQVAIVGGPKTKEGKEIDRISDLLLPLVKGYNSDRTYQLLADALQVFGGSGYCQDYPLEQYIRDQKIDTLYEGTTHIQALDLLFRKVARDNGGTLQKIMGMIEKTISDNEGGDVLKDARASLDRALKDVQGIYMTLMGKMGDSLYHVGWNGNRVLSSTAEVIIGWLLIRHAALAIEKREKATESDRAYYEGKVASAQFFAKNVLPGITLQRKLIEASDLSAMELDDAAFG